MAFAYHLRNLMQWHGIPFVDNPAVSFAFRPPTPRGRELYSKYGLDRFADRVSRLTIDESIGVLDLLDRLPARLVDGLLGARANVVPALKVLDIGSKNWRYLPALLGWVETFFSGRSVRIDGCEADAYRLYATLWTNISQARYFSSVCGSERFYPKYCAMKAEDYREVVDVITWFFPFVFSEQHRAWGLPESLFDPRTLFSSVTLRNTHKDTLIIIANQGEWEFKQTELLMASCRKLFSCSVVGSLHPSVYPIFLSAWTREQ